MSLKFLIPLLIALALALILTDVPNTLDARFYYTGLQSQEYWASLEGTARHLYLWHELIDFLFITTYSLIFWRLVQFTFPDNPRLRFLGFVPGAFDYLETTTIVLILQNFVAAEATPWLGVVTSLKWSLGVALGLFLLLRFFLRKRKFSLKPK